MSFDNGWEISKDANAADNSTIFRKTFNLNVDKEKIYLLEVTTPDNIIRMKVNNSIIPGIIINRNEINYNVTEQLKEQNTIEIACKNVKEFDARLHCVNKLFIPDINLKLANTRQDDKTYLLEVKIKNAFDVEKQGILKYTIYTDKNKELQEKETPVFISGNAENLYRLQFELHGEINTQDLKVECRLYTEGELFDVNEEICYNEKYISHVGF